MHLTESNSVGTVQCSVERPDHHAKLSPRAVPKMFHHSYSCTKVVHNIVAIVSMLLYHHLLVASLLKSKSIAVILYNDLCLVQPFSDQLSTAAADYHRTEASEHSSYRRHQTCLKCHQHLVSFAAALSSSFPPPKEFGFDVQIENE